jgi:DNA polymerase I-like protein with 3'-5' exonuclease and polymerase domains
MTSWTAPVVSELPRWSEASRIAIDLETRDPQLTTLGPGVRRDGYVVGIAVGIEDGPAFYLPVAHEGGGNLHPTHVWAYLRDQAAEFTGDVVGANLQYDLDYLLENGVEFPKIRFFRDVQVAEPLLDELQLTYSLEDIAARRGLPGKAEDELQLAVSALGLSHGKGNEVKKNLWRLPAKYVGAYAEQDVRLPLQLIRRQEREIDDQELWGIYDLESKLLPILTKLRRRGVRINWQQLESVEAWSLMRENEALQKLQDKSGVKLTAEHVWNAGLVEPVFTAIGVKVPRTPKTNQPSISNDFVKEVDHPAAEALIEARKFDKLRTTFCAQIRRFAVGDRVHCTFNQLRAQREDGAGLKGVAFGRLSSTDFNIQQMPSRDREIGPRLRSVFVPDEGKLWAVIDFGSQEPRLTVHYAAGCGLPVADEVVEKYIANPKTDLHGVMAELIGNPCKSCNGSGCPSCNGCGFDRKSAKEIFLGLCYGMGGAKLCHKLSLPTRWEINRRSGKRFERAGAEGDALLRKFNAAVPFVKLLSRKAQRRAEARGYIETLLGRRCRFEVDEARSSPRRTVYDWCYKALNRLIQGSAADQTKKAMLDAEEAGFELQIQVHDEFDLSVGSVDEARALGEIMCNAVQLRVPTVVDVEVGESWGTVEKV